MKGKIAIITGVTSGIGREAALVFAEEGIKVVAAGRNEKLGRELVDEIRDKKGEAIFVQTDVSKAHEVSSLVKAAQKHFGGVDIAFNNAGIEGVLGPLIDMEEEHFDNVINTNLRGTWLCLKYQIPAMIKRGGGAIVNVSTNISEFGIPGTSAYIASKAGVNGLTQVAAVEYGKMGLRVNMISPGAVDTPMLQRIVTPELLKHLNNNNPLGRIAISKEIAQTALWLFSPKASHVNGANIVIDGGHSLNI